MLWFFKFIELNDDFARVAYIYEALLSDGFDGEFIYYFKTKKVEIIKKSKNDTSGKSAMFLAANISAKYADLERKQHKDYYCIATG